MGSYVFRWPYPAGDVHVTGTFDDWGMTEKLERVGDHWEKEVDLSSADHKILYKFVVDGQWIVDDAAPKEDDGHWNVNNVLYPEHIKKREIAHSTPGAFPETPSAEKDAFSVNPIPATNGSSNPISLPAGDKVPEHKEITDSTIGSNVTTSKEAYENAGSATFPSAKAEEESSFSVNPIPASSGVGNPISLPAGEKVPEHKEVTTNTLDSKVTTSKEDYENAGNAPFPSEEPSTESAFSVNPIPASSGLGNPVSIPAGEKVPEHKDVTSNTVDSTVTTSKEDYDNAGSFSTGAIAGMAAGATAGVAAAGAAVASAFKKPEAKENVIPESSLPMGGEKYDTLDKGPFMSSAAPGTSAAQLAAGVPLEKKRQAMIIDPIDAPTSATTASSVPETVQHSIAQAHQDPEAAASSEAVKEKSVMEKELLAKTHSNDLTSSSGAASAVPGPVQASLAKAHQEPEAAASSEAVKEKSAMEKELLSKTQSSEASGLSETSPAAQNSYYGLATSVPPAVESSMQKAHAAPEAAAETSVVAEKSAMEKELLAKVPTADQAGEPAPTIASATSETAPAVGAAVGGAVLGGAGLAGLTAAASHHKEDKVAGTSRSAAAAVSDGATETSTVDSSKIAHPIEKSEGATTEYAPVRTDGSAPGVSSAAAAAISDGTEDPTLSEEPVAKPASKPASQSMVGSTIHDMITSPTSVTPSASVIPSTASETVPVAPLASTTDSATKSATAPVTDSATKSTTVPTTSTAPISSTTDARTSTVPPIISGAAAVSSVGTGNAIKAEEKSKTTTASTPGPAMAAATAAASSAPSTPAKKATAGSGVSSPANSSTTAERKKRHRLSAFFKKLID